MTNGALAIGSTMLMLKELESSFLAIFRWHHSSSSLLHKNGGNKDSYSGGTSKVTAASIFLFN
ncbi:hypothetical protein IAD21_05472 [Abditibacteriota bacterium]|nr:hypothetical protein IAD21_05472 [Abditibacteriota bacterium]